MMPEGFFSFGQFVYKVPRIYVSWNIDFKPVNHFMKFSDY